MNGEKYTQRYIIFQRQLCRWLTKNMSPKSAEIINKTFTSFFFQTIYGKSHEIIDLNTTLSHDLFTSSIINE